MYFYENEEILFTWKGQYIYIYLIQNLVFTDISAYPDSVNVLDGVSNDVRTPDKLIDGQNDTSDGTHMWLTPVLPNMVMIRKKYEPWSCLFKLAYMYVLKYEK